MIDKVTLADALIDICTGDESIPGIDILLQAATILRTMPDRPVRIENGWIVLPSGRKLNANDNIIGLGENGTLYGGYDQRLVVNPHDPDDPGLSPDDHRALCVWMAGRWRELAGPVEPYAYEFWDDDEPNGKDRAFIIYDLNGASTITGPDAEDCYRVGPDGQGHYWKAKALYLKVSTT